MLKGGLVLIWKLDMNLVPTLLLTHTNQLLFVPFCDLTAGIVKWDRTGQTDANNTNRRLK